MIVTTLTIAGLLAVVDSSDVNTQLFDRLDKNQDGVIASGELGESQQIWFTRALRVSDADGDVRLTPKELAGALADAEPRSAPVGRSRGQRWRVDPQRLDRNNNKMITLDEVPGPEKERFQKLLERMGKDVVSVETMISYNGAGRRFAEHGSEFGCPQGFGDEEK